MRRTQQQPIAGVGSRMLCEIFVHVRCVDVLTLAEQAIGLRYEILVAWRSCLARGFAPSQHRNAYCGYD
jgi:hypothetical protein